MSNPIEDYGLIGDCETAALVSRDGSIDWLCWPRFDSQACFAALLGHAGHGRWLLAPSGAVTSRSRRYRPDTLILETTFETVDGIVTVVDFMPPRQANSDVVRLVTGVSGRVTMECELAIRFDYGSQVPWISPLEDGSAGLSIVSGPESVTLRTPVPLDGADPVRCGFTVSEGETVPFVLTHRRSCSALPRTHFVWSAAHDLP